MNIDEIMHMPLFFLIANWWTPVFVGFFLMVLFYALRPRNRATFDDAAKMPLRED
jgi:cytochrome c oxidase cbb3-type subunit IV